MKVSLNGRQEWNEDLLPTIFHHKLREHLLIKKYCLLFCVRNLWDFPLEWVMWNETIECKQPSFHKQFNAFSQNARYMIYFRKMINYHFRKFSSNLCCMLWRCILLILNICSGFSSPFWFNLFSSLHVFCVHEEV